MANSSHTNPNYPYGPGPSSAPAPPTPREATPASSSSNISTPGSSAGHLGGQYEDYPSSSHPSGTPDYPSAHTYEVSPPSSPNDDRFPPALLPRGTTSASGIPSAARSDSSNLTSDLFPRSLTPGITRASGLRETSGSRPVSQLSPSDEQSEVSDNAGISRGRSARDLRIPAALRPAAAPAYQIPEAPAPPPLPPGMSYDHRSINTESQSPSPWSPSGASPSQARRSHGGGFLTDKVLGSFRQRNSYQQISSGDDGFPLEDLPEGDLSNFRALPHSGKRGAYRPTRGDSDDEDASVGFDISSFGGGPMLESQRSLSPTELKEETERNLRREQGNYAAEFHQLEKLESQGISNGLGGGMLGSRTDFTAQPDGSIAPRTSERSVEVSNVRSRVGITRGRSIRDIAQREAKQRQQMVVVNEYPGVDLGILGGGGAADFGTNRWEGSERGTVDGQSKQSFYFPEDPEMPNWKPFSMRWPYITLLVFLASAMAGLQEFLFQLSTKRGGLLEFKSPKELSVWQYFCWKYMPTLVAVTYGIMWQVVDFEVKRLEPYYQLSKKDGALAEESLSIDYLNSWHYLTPFTAIRYKHWAVMYCSVATLLAGSIAPTVQSASVVLTPTQKLRKPNEPKYVRMHHIWSRVLTATFLITATFGLLLMWHLRRKSGLLSDPKGIAGVAAMATKSHILMDFQGLDRVPESEIHRMLRNRRYVLHKSSLWQGEYLRIQDQRSERKVQNPHPIMLRKKAGIPYIIYIAAFMGVVPVLVFTRANIVTEKAPWLLTAGAVVIKLIWNTLECAVRMMEPFYILSRRHAPSNTLTLDYTGTVPGVMPIVALLNGHFLVALVGLNAVLAEVLTVCVSSFGVKGSDFLGIDTGQPDGEETFRSFWVSLVLAMAILLSLAISACIVYRYRGHAFLPRQPGTIASVLAFIHQSKMLWDFVDTEKMNANQMTVHLGEKGKKYGFGWFTGRDKKTHCGIDEEELSSSYKHGSNFEYARNPWEDLGRL
ncbi:hypothetical protein GP486_001303 [Trichoglossum hirsutum]|uniref:Uncharacterized protein n=1 Tax=Trichoglossum hirsutum TaxID=265104 RepID=A0A9P8RSR1_9PEZI|nr:hypothetical protein GP486_001303 [Trichoglossum hirsutum]